MRIRNGIITQQLQLPLTNYSGIILDYSFPLGLTGTYIPKLSDALVSPPGAVLTRTTDPVIFTNGNIQVASLSAGLTWFLISGLPAKATSLRKYELWGYTDDTYVNDRGLRIAFNFTDANNFWEWTVYSYSGSGTLRSYFGNVSGGSFNFRGSAVNVSPVQGPAHWSSTVYDLGDTVTGAVMAWEADTTVDVGGAMTTYNAGANRVDKNSTSIVICNAGASGGFMRLRGIRISDI